MASVAKKVLLSMVLKRHIVGLLNVKPIGLRVSFSVEPIGQEGLTLFRILNI